MYVLSRFNFYLKVSVSKFSIPYHDTSYVGFHGGKLFGNQTFS